MPGVHASASLCHVFASWSYVWATAQLLTDRSVKVRIRKPLRGLRGDGTPVEPGPRWPEFTELGARLRREHQSLPPRIRRRFIDRRSGFACSIRAANSHRDRRDPHM
jgi:hypothetical protein